MSIIFIERAFTNSPHLFIETVWPCYTVHHVKLAPAVLLTKFGSPRALFNVFDPRGPRGPRTPYPCKTLVATPLYMLLTKFGQNPIINVEGVANCQKEEEEEEEEEERNRKKVIS